MKPSPTRIEKHSPTDILLGWNDGAQYTLAFTELRFACPCAHCIDEHTGEQILQRTDVSADVHPTAVAIVGRYAAQIRWSDGHETGIYHFDRLHDLCVNAGHKIA
jgi:DUF971 family protein